MACGTRIMVREKGNCVRTDVERHFLFVRETSWFLCRSQELRLKVYNE